MKKKDISGILFSALIAACAYFLGKKFPVIGGPVFGILFGIILNNFNRPESFESGIKFTSKKVLQLAVVLLGFGLNLGEIIVVGKSSLLIILSTISTALIIAFAAAKVLNIDSDIATLVGVGSSICGGSAIAATAPVINAKDEDIATSISVIFLFNIIAALIFPTLGVKLGMTHTGFGMWAGTAINDTSSVVAASGTWSTMFNDDTALNYATIVKLTRTLAIIPITLVLGIIKSKDSKEKVNPLKAFPTFILFFLLASIVTTLLPLPETFLSSMKFLSKFFIIMAMSAIGLNTDIKKLISQGGKAILEGALCWIGIICVSLLMQHILSIW
ncbi:MAG: YeiH family protein [Peptoniphilus grossensis]|uniref:YeiH family protein n=1 Tax=Peptoniphilus grossensis TaxID=1465756 RepID=UPI002587A001|nr:YeiH family protein [Peptoniphilus grossensis]MDU5099323.1 YeiH family protein [Peptoniphilus grossensis]